ncbi:MAG: GNAT family N-acetyltransferase [Gammaproteobacteria bacterium]|nr:GNAT family N-acetyltransferase [Gammaproteobacteria bacterium]
MKFVCYTDWDQLPESADALFEQGEKEKIFFSRPWFENLAAAALDDDQAMVLACVVTGDEVLSILPLMRRAGNTWYSLRHRYTSHYSLLLADNDQQRILECLAEGLSRLPIRALLLEPVAADDIRICGLQRSLESAGFSCDYSFRLYNWIYPVRGESYEDYMAARPARLRNTIVRKSRKLEREHGYEIRLFTGDEVPQAMPDYHAVYAASWKANEQYADFLNGIVVGFSRYDWSRLAVLYVKRKPVAAQLWFVAHGRASIFRLAYDEAWRRYSPGSILTSFLMEYVIDVDGVDEIDFLTGNDAYKQDWMSDRRERFALSCVKSVKPAGRYELFVESLRGMLKRLSGSSD